MMMMMQRKSGVAMFAAAVLMLAGISEAIGGFPGGTIDPPTDEFENAQVVYDDINDGDSGEWGPAAVCSSGKIKVLAISRAYVEGNADLVPAKPIPTIYFQCINEEELWSAKFEGVSHRWYGIQCNGAKPGDVTGFIGFQVGFIILHEDLGIGGITIYCDDGVTKTALNQFLELDAVVEWQQPLMCPNGTYMNGFTNRYVPGVDTKGGWRGMRIYCGVDTTSNDFDYCPEDDTSAEA